MSNLRIGDMVEVPRLGPGLWEVVNKMPGANAEVQVKQGSEKRWIFEVHCLTNVKQRIANAKNHSIRKQVEANKILSKPRKR